MISRDRLFDAPGGVDLIQQHLRLFDIIVIVRAVVLGYLLMLLVGVTFGPSMP